MFSNLKISSKLIIGFLVVALLVGLVGVFGINSNKTLQENNEIASSFAEFIGLLDNSLIQTLALIETQEIGEYQQIKANIENLRKEFDVLHEKNEEVFHQVQQQQQQQQLDKSISEFVQVSNRIIAIHKEKLVQSREFTEKVSLEKDLRRKIRTPLFALNNVALTEDVGFLQYKSKEALYQYQDQKHVDEWLESIAKVENSATDPDVLQDIKSYQLVAQSLGEIVIDQKMAEAQETAQAEELENIIARLQESEDRMVATIRSKSESVVKSTFLILLIAVLIAFTGSVALGLYITRSISRPLRNLSQIAQTIAAGDLTKQAEVKSKDEIGKLAGSFNAMVESLIGIEKYTQSIVASMPTSLVVVYPDATIRSVNPGTCKILGYKEEELIGRPAEKIFGAVVAPPVAESLFRGAGLEKLIKKGTIRGKQMLYLSKKSEKIPVQVSGTVVYDEKGKLQYIIVVAEDLRELRKYAAKRLGMITPILQKVAMGDFSENVEIPEEEDEFTKLFVILNSMIDDLKKRGKVRKETEEARIAGVISSEKEKRGLVEEMTEELGQKVAERTKELQEKVLELERFNKITMGREVKILELKEEVARLKGETKESLDTPRDKKSGGKRSTPQNNPKKNV